MQTVKQAVILAGGKGTRLRPFTYNNPKPMVPINGKPFLEYTIEYLREYGINEVLILVGYLGKKIEDYFGNGQDFGLSIKYSYSSIDSKTGKRIKDAANLLDSTFLLMYCDNFCPLMLDRVFDFYFSNNQEALVSVYNNKKGISKNNILVDENNLVKIYDKTRTEKNLNGVEIGYFILKKNILEIMPNTNFSFERIIMPKLIENNELSAYTTDTKYYSIGDNSRVPLTEKFFSDKKVIFLDRDGVINRKADEGDYVKNWDEFVFLPGVKESIVSLTKAGYLIFIITNQAGIYRKMMSLNDLETINNNMINELNKKGAKIIKIYFCPHGWDEGCDCRKPNPGMLINAADEFNLDLRKCILIGDDVRDIQAGEAVGCKSYYIDKKKTNLPEIVANILSYEKK